MKTVWQSAGLSLLAMVGLWSIDVRGQVVGYSGSTAQGDALRGQESFLRGMAWYELGSAQAAAINQDTVEAWNRSVQAGYNQYLLERARRAATRRSAINTRVE